MADLRATPMVNPVMGLLADRLKKVQQFGAKPFGYENPPVEMLMNLLGVPAVQQTMERMAYGEPLTTGSGMTTKPRAEAVEAAMAVAPVAGLLGKATKGLPVGASIENVGKFNVTKRDASEIFGEGAQRFKYTDPKSGGSIDVLARPDGTASVLELQVPEKFRGKGIGESLQKQVLQDFPDMQGQVSSKAAATTAYRLGRRPVDMPNATLKDVHKMIDEDSSVNMISPKMQERIRPSANYPQQEALDTAQRNAALPIEEGGLGLPKDNTAMDRAEAMGFIDAYHGTTQGARKEQLRNAELWATDNPKVANTYATGRPEFGRPEGQTVMPLSVRLENPMVIDAPFGASWRQIDTALPNDPEVLPYSTDMLSDIAKKQGYDSLVVKNVFDVGGGKIPRSQKGQDALTGTTYAVFDPAQVRSRFAAFDPMRKNEKDILAGVLPLGLLADEEQRKKIYELMPSLLGQ